ncbi:MAG: S8 family serine peptidase [Acidobacteria bacterium]|nr:S8 family serine peptidase [Acidobacteriota bacterium]
MTDTAGKEISPAAQLQIKALLDEKESRTPAQQKIDSQLLYAARARRGDALTAMVPDLVVDVDADETGTVTVDITADVSRRLLSQIRNLGAEVLSSEPNYHTLRADVSLDRLEDVAGLPGVRFIQPKQGYLTNQLNSGRMPSRSSTPPSAPNVGNFFGNQPRYQQIISDLAGIGIGGPTNDLIPNGYTGIGSANAEGVTTMGAYSARGAFNADGTGIKIGVLSNGVVNLATSQASGDLGAVTVLPGQTGSADEGTAMLEVIHDIAPGAQLYFATGLPTITQFAQNIRDLRTAGCDIIVDDLGYFVESPFQDGQVGTTNTNGGVVIQAVKDVTDAGALYFSSASNSGNKNDGTSGTWEGDFVSGGTLALIPGGGLVHDFDPSAAVAQSDLLTLGGGGTNPVTLNWSDPLGASANDYDLFILNNAGTTVVASSTNVQSGTQDPYEQTGSNTTNNRAVIRQAAGAANRFLHLNTNRGRLSFSTDGTTFGHSHVDNAYSVAATPAYAPFNFASPPTFFNGPYPALHGITDKVETFSSDGPRRVFFQPDGTPYTPGNVSSTGGVLRQKPDLTAPDGMEVTGVGGFGSPFFGTSCAAPAAAAVAGLLKSANPALTPAQIRSALTAPALDIETPGVDRDAGAGTIMAVPSFISAGLTGRAFLELNGTTLTEAGGNGNGIIENGEGGTLLLNLKNTGPANATGITATLTTSTPNVTVTQGSSAYADLASLGSSGNNITAFAFQTNNLVNVDQVISFTLTVNYTGGWNASQAINFTVPTGRLSISSVIDAVAPTTSASFPTAVTGLQTARLFRADPASTCAAPHAFPGTSGAGNRNYDAYTLNNPVAAPVCASITILTDKTTVDFLQVVAYSGSFNPVSLGTNYLGDIGASPSVGYPKTMSVTVPANGTVVITVNAATSATSIPIPYTLKVSGLRLMAPSAAGVSVSGRITLDGRGVPGIIVKMADDGGAVVTARTNSFGYYRFDGVATGRTYTFQAAGKSHIFEPRILTVLDETELNFNE